MDVKILCVCGTKFAFEADPADNPLAGPIPCPACGADATATANDILTKALPPAPPPDSASQPSPSPSPRSAVRVRVGPPPAQPAAPPTPTAAPAPAAAANADSEVPSVPRCAKHPAETAVAECAVCGKPMCHDCLDQFGFVCSIYCRQQADQRQIQVPLYAGQKQQVRTRERKKELRILAAIPVLLTILGAAYAWYLCYGSRPHARWIVKPGANARFTFADWIDDARVVALSSDHLTLYQAGTGKVLWQTSLPPEAGPKSSRTLPARVVGDALWTVQANRVARFDLATGQRKSEVPLPQPAEEWRWSDQGLLVISATASNLVPLTWVEFSNGQARAEFVRSLEPPASSLASILQSDDRDADGPQLLPLRTEYFVSGKRPVQLTARLLQERLVPLAKVREDPGPDIFDREGVRASDSTAAVGQFLRNTAEERLVDLSRYTVTLRPLFSTTPDWQGELAGRPALFTLKTVQVLIAGTNIVAFNPTGQKRWEAKLGYPVALDLLQNTDRFAEGPCCETATRLLVFDQATLTAYDPTTGKVLWRVQAVGISSVQAAPGGALYVAATTAGPESLAYASPKAAGDVILPLLLKVDPASGNILWQSTEAGGQLMVSGKFVYATRAQSGALDLFQAAVDDTDVQVHYRVIRIHPGKGNRIWEYYQPRPPVTTRANANRFLLLHRDELQLVQFLSF